MPVDFAGSKITLAAGPKNRAAQHAFSTCPFCYIFMRPLTLVADVVSSLPKTALSKEKMVCIDHLMHKAQGDLPAQDITLLRIITLQKHVRGISIKSQLIILLITQPPFSLACCSLAIYFPGLITSMARLLQIRQNTPGLSVND